MQCHRCGSTMVHQKFYGPHEHFWGWRCIFCGDILDETILENRSELQGLAMLRNGSRRKSRVRGR